MIQIQNDATMWQHFVSIAVPIIGAFFVKELSAWLRDRRKERREAFERDKAGNEFAVLLKNYPLHYHTEAGGPLHAENIRLPRE